MVVQNREVLGKGWKFPFRIGGDSLSHDGPEQSVYETHVVECLWQRIMVPEKTMRGARSFGSKFFELPFEELVRAPGLAEKFIADAIIKEPRVELLSNSTQVSQDKNQIDIRVEIEFIVTGDTANLVFPFYRSDTGRPTLSEIQITLE